MGSGQLPDGQHHFSGNGLSVQRLLQTVLHSVAMERVEQ